MPKKLHLKKKIRFFLIILIIVIIILLILKITNQRKDYSVEYNYQDFAISENFDAENKVYYYKIKYNNITYNFIYEHKHINAKKMINSIEEQSYDDYTCLIINSNYISSEPLCSYKKDLISYNLVPIELQKELPNYKSDISKNSYNKKNYEIYNNIDEVLIWSYKGFDYIENNEIKNIKIFNKDIYEIPLATKINNYIIIPNYEQDYEFTEIYVLNLTNYEVKKWSIKYSISFDSKILGINDKSIFLLDKKNNIEYEIVPHKQKMRIVGTENKKGLIYNEDEIKKVSISKIKLENIVFTYKNNYIYNIKNNNLYLTYNYFSNSIKVSDNNIKKIVYSTNDTVYYLVDNELYKYSIKDGETLLLKYSEWEYNYQNNIFINN